MSLEQLCVPGDDNGLQLMLGIAGTDQPGGGALPALPIPPMSGFTLLHQGTSTSSLYYNGSDAGDDDDDDEDEDSGGVMGFANTLNPHADMVVRGPKGNIPVCQRLMDPSSLWGPTPRAFCRSTPSLVVRAAYSLFLTAPAARDLDGSSDPVYICSCGYMFTVHPFKIVNKCSVCRSVDETTGVGTKIAALAHPVDTHLSASILALVRERRSQIP